MRRIQSEKTRWGGKKGETKKVLPETEKEERKGKKGTVSWSIEYKERRQESAVFLKDKEDKKRGNKKEKKSKVKY